VGGEPVLDDVELTAEPGPCSATADADEELGASDSTTDGFVDGAAPAESCPAVDVGPDASDAEFDVEFDVEFDAEPAPWPSPEPLSAAAVALPARNTALIAAATNPAPNHRTHGSVTI
jgi:hypothetical protein